MANSKILMRTVEEIPFNLLSPEEIRQFSVTKNGIQSIEELKRHQSILEENVVIGPEDTQLDQTPNSKLNLGNSSEHFGHFGHVELAYPVFHIGFLTEIITVLECVCFDCSRLLVNPSHPKVKEITSKSRGELRKRLFLIHHLCKNENICGSNGKIITDRKNYDRKKFQKQDHVGCGRLQPKFSSTGLGIMVEWNGEVNDSDAKKICISAEKVHDIFKHIEDETCEILGFDYNFLRPDWMLVTVLPVPILSGYNSSNQTYSDLKIKNIVECNNELHKNKQNARDTYLTTEKVQILQFHVATMIDVFELPRPMQKLMKESTFERRFLMNNWNQTTITYPAGVRCIHELFEAQVEHDGQAIAVVHKEEKLTYSELNCRANQLAHYLIHLGVKPETKVALCVDRSPTLIIAILGILKAGGAYVPLDPAYPCQRLFDILNDCNPLCLLVDAIGRNIFNLPTVPVIDLDKQELITLPTCNPDPSVLSLAPVHLAYVIYTSGSTGIPKGVMVEHRQITRLLKEAHKIFGFSKQDKLCLLYSFAFDASVMEIWGALVHGAQLIIAPYYTMRSPVEFYEWVYSSKITILDQTPSAFKMFMRGRNLSSLGSLSDSLRVVNLAMEPVDPLILKEWNERYGESSTIFFNSYGPTETTVLATNCQLEPSGYNNSIGRPLSDMKVYLLDQQGELVPFGVEGEVYIGGSGVARGYFNRPELNAKHFLLDPFSRSPGARMYRSGDRACYLPDRNLMYLGRIDHQVKIRGFRIEPGEIRNKLVEHPLVQDAVVLPLGDGVEKYLVAYVVTTSDSISPQILKNHLCALLPDYMVPVAYVCLPALPLTPNGKVDSRALPIPERQSFTNENYEKPYGEKEEILAVIWSDLLGVDHISRHDNFFALGGHSLLAGEMLAQLHSKGLNISAEALYNSPTLAALADKIGDYLKVCIPHNLITQDSTKITPDMLKLIQLSQEDIDTIILQVPGGVSNIQDIYSLAPLQRGILFHHLMAREEDPYLLETHLRFTDTKALDRYVTALEKVVERHDILRTAFIWEGLKEPAQVVWRRIPSFLTDVTCFESEEEIQKQMASTSNRINLTKPPLLHLVIAQEADGRWRAVQLMHHLIIEHYTAESLQVELHKIITGQENSLETPVPFRNLIAQVYFETDSIDHKQFFSKMLNDIDTPALPYGLKDVHLHDAEFSEAVYRLSQTLSNNLRIQAQRLKVTVASICHVAFAKVLSALSESEVVVFGTVLNNRQQDGNRKDDCAWGLWINTLPFRLNVDQTDVESVIRDTHTLLSELIGHKHAPLALAQRCSRVPNSLPLFSALFNYTHETPSARVALPGVDVLRVEEKSNYPINITVQDCGNSLLLSTQVISPASANRVNAYMEKVLTSLIDALSQNPKPSIQSLAVVPESELYLLLKTFNQSDINHQHSNCCIHQLFEAQVKCNGESTAIEFEGETLSYNELNTQSNRLAHYLISQGVKPETKVALSAVPSPTLIVALLGILKSGGAYVPLDPSYPGQRLNHILHDAKPLLLLADKVGQKAIGVQQVPIIDLDQPLPESMLTCTSNIKILDLTPQNLAYVIYTSGSTGVPKGVMVEHRQVTRLFDVTKDIIKFSNYDKWCLLHSFSFDVSVWEMWGALAHGGQLAIAPLKLSHSPSDLYNWVCTSKITVLDQSPLAFRLFIKVRNSSSLFDKLRVVCIGNDILDPLILKEWNEKCVNNETLFFNMYGPTETTVQATCCQLDPSQHNNSIGRPLPDVTVYVLDRQGEPVPLGVKGELYIGGAGVARGYLNLSELTARHFLSDPFSKCPKARMYRSGDLARYQPDGNLIYLGRIDNQIKIRGYRVEPAEIEASLAKHPLVNEAIVLAKGDGAEKLLVAYILPNQDDVPAQDLRNYLVPILPDYMIPAAYMCLKAWPLMSSGKINRSALPAPNSKAFARHIYEGPQTEEEETLASIWSTLLGVSDISRHDNFFALGGNSLLVVQMLTQLRECGLNTNVKEVFNSSTLATLAKHLERYRVVHIPPNYISLKSTKITPSMLPLIELTQADIDQIVSQVPGGVSNIQDIYSLAPLQQEYLLLCQKKKNEDPLLLRTLLRFSNRSTLDSYVCALQKVIMRHDILRTAFIWEGLSKPAQVVWREVPSILTHVTFIKSEATVLEQLTKMFHRRHYRLDLTQAPLLRLISAQESDGSWVALELIHHLIVDHFSTKWLELEIEKFIIKQENDLMTPVPYRNLIAQVLFGSSLMKHVQFFREMLADIEEPTLPVGLLDVSVDVNEMNITKCQLPQALNVNLRLLARRFKVSLATLCHLAFAKVLASLSRRQSVVFGTVLIGRLQDGERNDKALGLWINILPFRVDVDRTTIEETVYETHARLSALLSHEQAPQGLAKSCSRVPDSLPLIGTSLNYRHHSSSTQITIPGIDILGRDEHSIYPINISVEDYGDDLQLTAEVVSSVSSEQMCNYMRQALSSLADALSVKQTNR